jgi:hypothetical protein
MIIPAQENIIFHPASTVLTPTGCQVVGTGKRGRRIEVSKLHVPEKGKMTPISPLNDLCIHTK